MGVVTETFVNLNFSKKPTLEEILHLITDLEEQQLISPYECGLVSNVNENFSMVQVVRGRKLIPSYPFKILYWGEDKEAWLAALKKHYHQKKNLALLLGSFHEQHTHEFEFEAAVQAPILLFVLQKAISPEIIDCYSDPEEILESFEEEEELSTAFNQQPIEFGTTTTYLKISSKIAPYDADLRQSSFGKYVKDKYNAVILSGYL